MKILVTALISLFIMGCSAIQVGTPGKHNIQHSRTYDVDLDTMWYRVVDIFAERNITIDKIQKESGLVTAKYYLDVSTYNFLDCGSPETTGWTSNETLTTTGRLNITIRPREDKTKVSVNFFGEFDYKAWDMHWDKWMYASGTCVSTGEFEQIILDDIDY